MNFKLIISHITILLISFHILMPIYSNIKSEEFNLINPIIHFIIVLYLYFLSGYVSTGKTDKYRLKNYYIVTLIGFIIWILAILSSPNDMDWKNGNRGILWLVYTIYISSIEVPFNFNDNFSYWTKNTKTNMLILLIFSIIPLILQALGGLYKVKKHHKTLSKVNKI